MGAQIMQNPWSQVISPDDLQAYLQGEGADLAPQPLPIIPLDRSPSGAVSKVVPQAKGSGMSVKGEDKSNVEQDTKTMGRTVPTNAQEMLDALSNTSQYKESKTNLENLKSMLGMQLSQPSQVDLSPVMSLVDAWTGSHMAKDYVRPETPSEMRQKILAAYQQIQNDEHKNLQDLTQGVYRMTGTTVNGQKVNNGVDLTATAKDPTSLNKPSALAPSRFASQTNTESKLLRDGNNELYNIGVAINSGNPSAQKGVPLMMARFIEHARPAMAAAAMETGDPSFTEKMEQIYDKAKSGTMSEENAAQQLQYLGQLMDAHNEALQAMKPRWNTLGESLGLTPEQVSGMTSDKWLNPHASQMKKILSGAPQPKKVVPYTDLNDAAGNTSAPGPSLKDQMLQKYGVKSGK